MDSIASSELTDDALTDRVRVSQRRGGHRYSFDDVITAWVAVRSAPTARTYLDLGCGLGSVLLMVADRLPEVLALGIEAQSESFALARRNLDASWLAHRARLWLRAPAQLLTSGNFRLGTSDRGRKRSI
jgi:tRNA1(Val) A37 N6-methylase TrmN6